MNIIFDNEFPLKHIGELRDFLENMPAKDSHKEEHFRIRKDDDVLHVIFTGSMSVDDSTLINKDGKGLDIHDLLETLDMFESNPNFLRGVCYHIHD